jgi:hypothetical protein
VPIGLASARPERLKPPLEIHEVRLRGLVRRGRVPGAEVRIGLERLNGGRVPGAEVRIEPERLKPPLEIHEVRLRGLVRRGRVPYCVTKSRR